MFRLLVHEVILPCAVLIAAFCLLLIDDKGGSALYGGALCATITPVVLATLFVVRRTTNCKNDGSKG